MTFYYVCPVCGETYEEDYPEYCDNCEEKMPRRWADPYCGNCDTQLDWVDGGWYCENCEEYPDEVYFRDEE